MASAWGASFGSAWGSAWGSAIVPAFASLGAAPDRHVKKRTVTVDDEIEEAISAEAVSRIRNEFLSEALANDVIKRAKVRKARAEEALLLLLI